MVFVTYQCKNDTNKPLVNNFVDTNDIVLENEVLNQIFPSLFDSLKTFGEIGNEIILCYDDSLLMPFFDYDRVFTYFNEIGIKVDSIIFNKKNKIKLYLKQDSVTLISVAPSKYLKLIKKDSLRYLLFEFSRVCFNQKKTQGFFNLMVLSTPESGLMFSVLLANENNKWVIKRIIMSGII